MENIKIFANQIFNSQPFSRFMGAALEDCGTDFACISLAVSKEIQQQHGFVHGGALSYLADNSITFAGGLALGGDAVTSGSRSII